jgi:hypothetical protein
MKLLLVLAAVALAVSILLGWNFIFPPEEINLLEGNVVSPKTVKERIAEAKEKSAKIKGLYMTADVANDQGAAGTRLRQNLIRLAENTEINGLVIDVKEVCGPDYDEARLKNLLEELHKKNIWAIARIAISKDASQFNVHPEWYLQRKNLLGNKDECYRKKHLRVEAPDGKTPGVYFWQDKLGGYWLDPASEGARNYTLEFSKKIIDLGFDELQFDYIRFPSDGDVENIVYPVWDGKPNRCRVMQNYFEFLNKNLKAHRPEIILSADLFGYSALGIDTGIGQCIESIGDNFEYVSFMVYPSHYYSGLFLKAVPEKNLPEINFSVHEARSRPDIVVERSLRYARDFFDGLIGTTTAKVSTTTTPLPPVKQSKACNRPWLEDFYHEDDKASGRPYGAEKVRLQIDAAERVDNCGWLLWNAANIYTEGALKLN